MFGMLDFRANKLFILLFGFPMLLIRLSYTFGAPFLYYGIGLMLAENRFFQILISILALFLLEILWALIFPQLNKLIMFVFTFFVDVIPADGRTLEESMMVVTGGNQALFLLEFNKKSPNDWTEEDISILSGGFFRLFFKDKIEERIRMIRNHYIDNLELTPSAWNTNKYLESAGLKPSLFEQILTTPVYRAWATSAIIFILLMIFG